MNLWLLLLLTTGACGKIEKVQDSFIGLTTNNSLTMAELRIGFLYRHDPVKEPNGYDYLDFENTQYRLGAMTPEARSSLTNLPKGQRVQVVFKGKFAKRAGLSTVNPSLDFDIVELETLAKQ